MAPKSNIETRHLIKGELLAEVKLIVRLYNDSWSQNWGFLPLTDEDAGAIADSLRLIIDPELVRFAFVGGEAAAVVGVMPDPNAALRPRWRWYGDSDLVRVARLLFARNRISLMRGMFFGIKPEYRSTGLPILLLAQIADYLTDKGSWGAEGSLILEDNDAVIKVATTFGCRQTKRWRIYDLPLSRRTGR